MKNEASWVKHDCNSEWLTAAEAASYLKIERRTLLAWVREGTVKGYPLHGTKRRVWRFRREDLDASLGFVAGVVSFQESSSAVSRNGGGLQ